LTQGPLYLNFRGLFWLPLLFLLFVSYKIFMYFDGCGVQVGLE